MTAQVNSDVQIDQIIFCLFVSRIDVGVFTLFTRGEKFCKNIKQNNLENKRNQNNKD